MRYKPSKKVKLVAKAKSAARLNVSHLQEEITEIIKNRIDSEGRIELALDQLLDCLLLGFGEEEFERLHNYYSTINGESARVFNQFYQEIAGKKEERKTFRVYN